MRRGVWLGLVAASLGGGLALADEERPGEPGRTDVAAHTRVPIQPGRNALWCATFQLAWDAMAETVGTGGNLYLEAPAPPAAVAEMNRHAFPKSALDAPSFVAVAGLVRDGVLDRIRAAWSERFGEEPPAVQAGPMDAVAATGLRKELPFETPFRVLPAALRFGEEGRRVRAFGMEEYDHAPDVEAMAKQVVVWLEPDASERSPSERPVVMELVPKGGGDRIFLSSLPGSTLEEAWSAAWKRVSTGRRWTLKGRPAVAVPRIRLRSLHRFAEFVGAPIRGIDGSYVKEAVQRVDFSLTEKGASLSSDAEIVAYLGIEPRLVFDRPFLLALLRRGAERPYLLLWVGNEDLLEPYEFPRAPRERLAGFVGRWTMDLAPTVRATSERLPESLREANRESLEKQEFEFDLAEDGRAEARWRRRGASQADEEPWMRVPGYAGLFDGRLALIPDALASASSTEASEQERYEPFPLEASDGRVRIRVGGWFVLRAR